jgi:hypothetical protein
MLTEILYITGSVIIALSSITLWIMIKGNNQDE